MKTQITITNSTTLNDLPDVLTVATLAAYLHTTRQNICKMLIAGEIRSVKVGRSYRVPKVFLQEFLKEVSSLYEIVVFTASQSCYADAVLDIIDPNHYVK